MNFSTSVVSDVSRDLIARDRDGAYGPLEDRHA